MIPVNIPSIGDEEKAWLLRCLESGWVSSEGPFVEQFEHSFAERIGRRHGIAVSNGTAALEVAVASLGIGAGDEVVMPSFTIVSCAAAVVRSGATPVFVDSDPLHWNMDVGSVEACITERTKAIMAVHTYGLPTGMAALKEVADRHGLPIIEDAAEAHGLVIDGRPAGGFGQVSTFSFYANKAITTGEGGMVLTDDDDVARRCRSLRNLCFGSVHRFVHEELGWNHRMTSMQAALGMAQLERMESLLLHRKRLGDLYTKRLTDIPHLQLPLDGIFGSMNTYWVFGVVLHDGCPIRRDDLMERLAERGVGSRPFFWPMHEQPVFQRMGIAKGYNLPVSERLGRKGLYLPLGNGINTDDVERVCEAVHDLLKV
jgi:perosamine synthetase